MRARNGDDAPAADPFRPTMKREGAEWRPGIVPSTQSVVRGVLQNRELRRALILKLLILHREEMEEVGQGFTDRVRGYLDGTLRPWSLSP